MNVFEFARIVELNRAIRREVTNRCAQAGLGTIGVQTNDPGDATNVPGSGEGS